MKIIDTETYNCSHCGAPLTYKPGTTKLYCDHCGSYTDISTQKEAIEELDFNLYAEEYEKLNTTLSKVVSCRSCGATIEVNENLKTFTCPYCAMSLVEEDIHAERLIKPAYILPFNIQQNNVPQMLHKWLKSKWYAPAKLKKAMVSSENIQGYYIPYWTYDAQTETDYVGQRGDNYTETVGSGKNQRTVVRTHWNYAQGHVELNFDDVMVSGSKIVDARQLYKLGGWDRMNLVKINNQYLSGFVTEKYCINLQDGFKQAQSIMSDHIESAIRQDIGGDRQRISSTNTRYYGVTFKLIIVPVYTSAYRYKNKIYHYFINGRSGMMTGNYPYSAFKVILTILLILLGFYLVFLIAKML